MRCPNCSGERIVLAGHPGEQPGRTRVCLACASMWDAPPEQPRTEPRQPQPGAPPRG